MTDITSSESSSAREQAAHWCARIHADDMDAEERHALETWRRNPVHERELRAMLQLWDAVGEIPAARLQALTAEPRSPVPRKMIRRVAVFAVVALFAVGIGLTLWPDAPEFSADYVTRIGERNRVALPDGSNLELNTQTQIHVRYYKDRRIVELTNGEALFEVAHDVTRPFIVQTSSGEIQDVGTVFNVLDDAGKVAVIVQSGEVRITPRWWHFNTAVARLHAGEGIRIAVDDVATPVDVNAATAWREGKIVFDNRTLAEVAHDIARYRQEPIRLTDDRVAQLRISGVFSTDDPDALLRALPRLLPVAVRMSSDGSAEVSYLQ